MSGGSFNYLCHKAPSELLVQTDDTSDLQRMADALAKLGYAADAARETQDLLLTLRAFDNRVSAALLRLSPVWRAMEWWKSSDSKEDVVHAALAQYRGEKTP